MAELHLENPEAADAQRLVNRLHSVRVITESTVERVVQLADRHRPAVSSVYDRLHGVIGNLGTVEQLVHGQGDLNAKVKEFFAFPTDLKQVMWKTISELTICAVLLEALTCRSPGKALALIAKEDPATLWDRVYLTGYLSWKYIPPYSLQELAERTEGFIRHLEENRDALGRTGLPRVHFSHCPWLDANLAPLYPSAPSDWGMPKNMAPESDAGGPWLFHLQLRVAALRGCCSSEYTGCDCADAPFWDRLPTDDARKIEASRGKLLELKIGVLRHLLEAARRQNAERCWDACLDLVVRTLLAHEAELCFRMDEFYGGAHPKDGILTPCHMRTVPGGLTALLQLIGCYEQEITLGIWAAARDALRNLPGFDRPEPPSKGRRPSYFDYAGRPERKHLDAVLDELRSRAGQQRKFWIAYGERVNHALENSFEEEVTTVTRVRRSVIHRFKPHMAAYGELAASTLDATGQLPILTVTSSGASHPRPFSLTDTEDTILEALGQDTLRGKEIADRAGYSHDTVRRHLSNLTKLGLIENIRGEGYRRLPK